jgi:hypothetical protein
MGKRLIGSVGLKPGTDTGFDLDTKGQIHGYSDTQFALPVGTDDHVIYADSSATGGLAYGASAKSVLTTAGDLLVASGANTLSRLARGSDNQTLMMNGTSLNWETVSASGANTALSNLSSVSVNDTIDMNTNTLSNIKWNALKSPATLTISTGEVIGSQSNLVIDTEGSASTDDLTSCSGLAAGALTYQRQANDARDVTWVSNSLPGANRFTNGSDVTFTSRFDIITFLQYGANGSGAIWLCISNRDNG